MALDTTKNRVFVNFTNHPYELWSSEQKEEAIKIGTVIDLPFPQVDPYMDEDEITILASNCLTKIMQFNPACVLCQGEFNLSYAVIKALDQKGVPVCAACSKRNVIEEGERKLSVFQFVRFRFYGAKPKEVRD